MEKETKQLRRTGYCLCRQLPVFLLALLLVMGGRLFLAAQTLQAAQPKIFCSSVRRTSGTEAEAWIYSDTAGTIYYVVDEVDGASSTLTASQIVAAGNTGNNAAVAGQIKSVALSTGMYQGKKYAHLVVADVEDASNLSNIVTAQMPMTYWYSEDFEAYPDGYNNGSANAGVGFGTNNVIATESGNQVYRIYGTSNAVAGLATGQGSKACITVLEGKIKSGADTPNAKFSLQFDGRLRENGTIYSDYMNYDIAGIVIADGVWKSCASGREAQVLKQAPDAAMKKDKWYTVRIVFDTQLHQYDVYIDGNKANEQALTAAKYDTNHWAPNPAINRLYISSSAGQYTYFDDITSYSYPTDVAGITDPNVKFSKATANYVGTQQIELTTDLTDGVIYYTTDGSYPSPTTNAAATKGYTGAITVDTTTTIRAVAGRGKEAAFVAESVAYSETYTILATATIKGASVHRSAANEAAFWFISDVKGDVFYYVTGDSTVPEAGNPSVEWVDAALMASQNLTTVLTIKSNTNQLKAGARYVNIVVKDENEKYSNVLQYYLPYDFYMNEDFEAYPDEAVEGNCMFGVSKNYQKIVTLEGNRAFSKYVNYYWDTRIQMGNNAQATWVIEGKIRFKETEPSGSFRFGNIGVDASEGKWYARTDGTTANVALDLATEPIVKDRWYQLRIVYDRMKKQFDVYIDGKKANSAPLESSDANNSYFYLQTSGGTQDAASTTTYYDDLKAWCLSDAADNAVVKFSEPTAAYTTARDITLSTTLADRTIYYTTDGTYPDLKKNAANTKKYTAPVHIDATTTITALAGTGEGEAFLAESVAYAQTYTVVDALTLTGNSVYRESATKGYLWFNSNVSGDAYYMVSIDGTAPAAADIVSEENKATETFANGSAKGGAVVQDTITQMTFTNNMKTGARYVYVVVKDKDGVLSNVLSYHIPQDIYFKEDFEADIPGVGAGSYSGIYQIDNDSRTVVTREDGHKNVYQVKGNSVYGYRGFPEWLYNGTWVYEASFLSLTEDPSLEIRFRGEAGVRIESGVWKSLAGGTYTPFERDTKTCQKNEWHTVRLVYDRWEGKRVFDIYIDGKRANGEPIKSGGADRYSEIFLVALDNSKICFDDVECYYLPRGKDAAVQFDRPTAMYTTPQAVAMMTDSGDRTIYYSTDGSYPDVSDTEKTKQYKEPITVGMDNTRVRAIAGLGSAETFKADSVAYEENYSFVTIPTLTGSSVYRESATKGYVWFNSNVSGDVYYVIKGEAEVPAAETIADEENKATETLANGASKGGAALQDTVTQLTLTNKMKTGEKYAYVVLKDQNGTLSNVLSFYMPQDVYFKEDFESNLTTAIGGTSYGLNTTSQKIVELEGEHGKVFALTGVDPSRYFPDYLKNGTFVYEADFMSLMSDPTFEIRSYYDTAGIRVEDGVWKNWTNGTVTEFDQYHEKCQKNEWHKVRIVYDETEGKRVYDVYIDGKRANSEPITAAYNGRYTCAYLKTDVGSTVYFDNLEYYYLPKEKDASVQFTPGTAMYTVAQDVTMSTGAADRTIYYTTDGSYPDANDTVKTQKYEAPVRVGTKNTKVRAIAGLGSAETFKADSVAYDADYSFEDAPTIVGNTIYRENANKATVWFKSDIAGEVYYQVSESPETPTADELLANGRKAEQDVTAQATMALVITKDMSLRAKYIYVAVKDAEGSLSNVLKFVMPYEYYYEDGFDGCTVGQNTGAILYEDYYGFTWQKEEDGNQAYTSYKTVAYDLKSLPYLNGTSVFEARFKSDSENPTFAFGMGNAYQAMLYVDNGVWKCYAGNNTAPVTLDNMEGKALTKNKWYRLKIAYTKAADGRTMNIWIADGDTGEYEAANSSPIKVNSTSKTATVCGVGTTGQTMYYDDIKWYVDTSLADMPKEVRNLTYDGTEKQGVVYDEELSAYTMSGDVKAVNAGNYQATFTLREGFIWKDGTKEPKTVSWSIAKKTVTMTGTAAKVYDGNDAVTVTAGALSGILEADAEKVGLNDEQAAGYFADKYAGTGKSITLEADSLFALTGEAAGNYELQEPVLTGDIIPAVQTLTKARTLEAAGGETLTDNQLKTAVKGAKGQLAFVIVQGAEYADYTAGTGLVLHGDAAGKTITMKATAAAADLNADEIPEYAADTEGISFDVTVNAAQKTQNISFSEEEINIAFGVTGIGQEAVCDVDDGGAITYSSDDESVVIVDAMTGELTIIGVGKATITAVAAKTSSYNSATAGYVVNVTEASQRSPRVGKTNETIEGRNDGTITKLTTDMEYRKEGEDTYKAIADTTLTGLAPGTYYVRYRAKTNYKASADAKVVIEPGTEDEVLTFAKMKLNVVYGQKNAGQTAESNVDDGGAITYTIDDENIAKVDSATGKLTITGVGTATVTAASAATELYTGTSASYTLTVGKAAQKAPKADKTDETIFGKKDGIITGLTIDMEYRREGEEDYTSVSGNSITGLAPGVYYVRYQGKPYYKASEETQIEILAGVSDEVLSFAKSELNVTFDEKGVGQKAVSSVDDGGTITYTSDNTKVALVDETTGAVTIKGVGTAKITAVSAATELYAGTSASYTLTVGKAAQKTPVVGETAETIRGKKDGTITGVTTDMEYRREGETTYTAVTGTQLTGLEAGTYYVRYKGTDNYNPSGEIKVEIASGKAEEKKEETPVVTPEPEPIAEYDENVPVEKKETVIVATNTDKKDVEGSTQQYLMVQMKPKATSIKLTWKAIPGANGYLIYGSACGKKLEYITTIENGNTKSWTAKKLKKGQYYKYMVVAYRNTPSGRRAITTSKTVHATTTGGKKGNPSKLVVKKKNITLGVGKKQAIKASYTEKQKVSIHISKFRYESADPKIATVDKKGKVKGVSAGKTTIYVYTQNGLCKTVKVTVK